MKKKVFIIIGIIILLGIVGLSMFSIFRSNTFRLEEKYYQSSGFEKIDANELTELLNAKGSFLVFTYQPLCAASANFEENINNFLGDNPLTIYQITYSDLKETQLTEKVTSYPSLLIFKKGHLIDFLETDQDADTSAYETVDGLKSWLTQYISLQAGNSNNTSSEDEAGLSKSIAISNGNLDSIKPAADDKINIYFFWGDGCPRCAEEHNFFREIQEQYGDRYNLYTFEVWYDDANSELMSTFAEAMGNEVKGIPYTIIGEETFVGFGVGSSEQKFLDALEAGYKSKFDVYFDKIK